MFECPVCGDWLLIHKTCNECDKIRQLCKLYGRDKLLEILDKTMVIQQHKTQSKDRISVSQTVEKQPTCELKIDEN